jgi:hypothetical protein
MKPELMISFFNATEYNLAKVHTGVADAPVPPPMKAGLLRSALLHTYVMAVQADKTKVEVFYTKPN